MAQNRENKDSKQNTEEHKLPTQLVFFYCRRDVCPPGLRIRQAKTLVDARKMVASDDIPVCPHGKMSSDRRLQPL